MQIQIQAQIQIQIYAYKYSTKYNKWGKESWVSRSSQLHSALSVRVWKCRYKYKCKYKYKYIHTIIQQNTTNEGTSVWSADPLNRTGPCQSSAHVQIQIHRNTNTSICTQIFNWIQHMSLWSADLPKYTAPTQCICTNTDTKTSTNTNIDTYTTNDGTTLGQLIHPLSSVYSNYILFFSLC